MAETIQVSDDTEIFKQLENYPWDKDKEFQGGLQAILGPSPSTSQLEDLTLRAQCFYLSRKKNIPIDFDAYKAYLSSKAPSQTSPPPSSQPQDPAPEVKTNPEGAPYPPTFAQIVSLITSGAEIPGIRDIPDTVLPEKATPATANRRRKPWEKECEGVVECGTFGDRRDEKPIEQVLPE